LKERKAASEADLEDIANDILRTYPESRVFAFYGSMGAGKTTLIKVLCHELGVKDIVQSPTFAIINEYLTPVGESIYHFDFYRIKKAEEAMDIGYEDYIYSGSYCFIEWPELIGGLLPPDAIKVYIEGDDVRTIRF
jgi:tRNA threonylcarbamoyladenosine biosynthesis protein TsaE